MIADVAIEIRRTYPDQLLGIEGHTDSDPVTGGQYRTNHELSATRALAVYDVLVNGRRLSAGTTLRRRARPESPGGFQRHAGGEAAEPAGRTGHLSRPGR